MAFDVHRKVLVMFGGFAGDILVPLPYTYEWDGSSWSLLSQANTAGLSSRRLHQMWYETGTQREAITILKPLQLVAYYGPVTIGQ